MSMEQPTSNGSTTRENGKECVPASKWDTRKRKNILQVKLPLKIESQGKNRENLPLSLLKLFLMEATHSF